MIVDENLKCSIKSKNVQEKKLRKVLSSQTELSKKSIDDIVGEVLVKDSFLSAQIELNTEFKREKFLMENFKYLHPEEIILNKKEFSKGEKKDVVHYVDIKESLRCLLEDKNVIDALEKGKKHTIREPNMISDFLDGSAFKSNTFFLNHPDAYAAQFYSDAVELTNPLSASKGKHKINQVYYTLCQFPKHQRSQIDRMQTVMVFKDNLIKKYGLKVIFHRLIEDLKILEKGFVINVPIEHEIRMGLLAYSGDNLEIHNIGGFSCCFSSRDICRICHASYKDLETRIHDYTDYGPHAYWSEKEYDDIVGNDPLVAENMEIDAETETDLEEHLFDESNISYGDDDVENLEFGLRTRCPFNDLQSFHATRSFPGDVMHDWFEGACSQDLYGSLKIWIKKKSLFDVETYNKRLRNFLYSPEDGADKPQELPKNLKGIKLPGKAVSIWVHIRIFPLLIEEFIQDNEDEILQFVLLIVDITNRLMANKFSLFDIEVLEDKIIEYLNKRMELIDLFTEELGSAKPKHHNLTHYGLMIRRFGPPCVYWTARWESRHRIAKNISEACKNFINITLTVFVRQQKRTSSIFYRGMYDTHNFLLPDKVWNKMEIPFMSSEIDDLIGSSDLSCKEILVTGQKYKQKDLVVLDTLLGGDELIVGVIELILVKENSEVMFIVSRFLATKQFLGFYESVSQKGLSVVKQENLADYKPLAMRGTMTKFRFVIHHYIPW